MNYKRKGPGWRARAKGNSDELQHRLFNKLDS
jgi:hypothetical protein